MAEVKIKPLGDFMLVLPKVMERTSSGIIIPENAQEKIQEGVVVVVGPGKEDAPMSLKAGDNVLFDLYSAKKYKHGDETYLIMRERDVYAVI